MSAVPSQADLSAIDDALRNLTTIQLFAAIYSPGTTPNWATLIQEAIQLAEVVKAMPQGHAAPFLTLQSASEYSGLPKEILAGLLRDGMLPGARHSGEWYIKRADLDALEPERAKP
jgi:hypothetical protein